MVSWFHNYFSKQLWYIAATTVNLGLKDIPEKCLKNRVLYAVRMYMEILLKRLTESTSITKLNIELKVYFCLSHVVCMSYLCHSCPS